MAKNHKLSSFLLKNKFIILDGFAWVIGWPAGLTRFCRVVALTSLLLNPNRSNHQVLGWPARPGLITRVFICYIFFMLTLGMFQIQRKLSKCHNLFFQHLFLDKCFLESLTIWKSGVLLLTRNTLAMLPVHDF